jgi:hypothetical protein
MHIIFTLGRSGPLVGLDSCFDLSNAINVTRNAGDDCGDGLPFDNLVISIPNG